MKLSTDGKYWLVKCKDDECRSGPINKKLDPTLFSRIDYKYDQVLDKDRCDGHVIIDP